MALVLIAIAFPSFRLLYILDEVISPVITIKVTGFFLGGQKLYILNKMKDTNLIGQKNNMCYQSIQDPYSFLSNRKRLKVLNINSRLSSNQPKSLFNLSILNQRRYYHISNIRSKNRIGPHNYEILSVVIGS